MPTALSIFLIGLGATALVDLWTLLRHRCFGVAPPDYAHLGRWLAHMRRGRFRHVAIAAAAPVRHERLIGWSAHYLIGIAFATLPALVQGEAWLRDPTPGPALLIGIGTVAAPFLLMQPGMGAGLAARRTPRPALARMQSLVTHAVFGLGLYLAAWSTSLLPLR
jgi:hypothetical protein